MNRVIKYHKTLGILLIVTILSLMDTDGIEPQGLINIPHFDKIVHFLMYFTLAFFLMFEYYLHHKDKIIHEIQVLLLPLFWGAAMEMMQLFFTDYRGAEWLDMLANTIGIIMAFIAVYIVRDVQWIARLILFPFHNKRY